MTMHVSLEGQTYAVREGLKEGTILVRRVCDRVSFEYGFRSMYSATVHMLVDSSLRKTDVDLSKVKRDNISA